MVISIYDLCLMLEPESGPRRHATKTTYKSVDGGKQIDFYNSRREVHISRDFLVLKQCFCRSRVKGKSLKKQQSKPHAKV